MSYSPETEESLCTTCSEFWATVTGKFCWYTERGEGRMEVANEAGSACEGCACRGSKNLNPARKAITYHKLMAATIGEEVGGHGFKQGRGWRGGEKRRGCLSGCISVAVDTSVSDVADIPGHAWPVNYGPGTLFHHCCSLVSCVEVLQYTGAE